MKKVRPSGLHLFAEYSGHPTVEETGLGLEMGWTPDRVCLAIPRTLNVRNPGRSALQVQTY